MTENGVSDRPESVTLCDQPRVNFFQNYLNNVLMAIRIDEVNVVGYTAWSLMDNFEWAHGYTERFGLFWTSFDRPDKLRTMKSSGLFYKKIVEARGFPSKQTLLDWLDEVDTYCQGFANTVYSSQPFNDSISTVIIFKNYNRYAQSGTTNFKHTDSKLA